MPVAQHRTPPEGPASTQGPLCDAATPRALANPRRKRLAHVTSYEELRAAAVVPD